MAIFYMGLSCKMSLKPIHWLQLLSDLCCQLGSAGSPNFNHCRLQLLFRHAGTAQGLQHNVLPGSSKSLGFTPKKWCVTLERISKAIQIHNKMIYRYIYIYISIYIDIIISIMIVHPIMMISSFSWFDHDKKLVWQSRSIHPGISYLLHRFALKRTSISG